jgi:hypothetical protein
MSRWKPSTSHRQRGLLCTRRRRGFLEQLDARILLSVSPVAPDGPVGVGTSAQTPQLAADYGQIPMSFEPNVGQAAAQVNYLSRGNGYTLSLTPTQAVLDLTQSTFDANGKAAPAGSAALAMKLEGANPAAVPTALDLQASYSNYLIGSDPSQWHTNVSNYGRVQYANVYSGIDLVYYGNQRQLEYDFTVGAGADPTLIDLSFAGADSVKVDGQGNLVLATAAGNVTEQAPVAYQQTAAAGRQTVAARYEIRSDGSVGLVVGAHDTSQPLVIDPKLSYSTYLGGSGSDFGYGIAADHLGSAYVTGLTESANFPTSNPLQPTSHGEEDAFVAKFSATGSLDYSTYLGGGGDAGYGIAVDASGNVYVTGGTSSKNFPTTGPFQSTLLGTENAFVAKLNATGNALIYSTYLGGSGQDIGYGIAVDASGDAYVTGSTTSADFPLENAIQPQIGPDPKNRADENAFLAKLDPAGATLVYSTYLGGSYQDYAHGIAVDGSGNAYVTGTATSLDFPTVQALQPHAGGGLPPGALVPTDAFVSKINAAGSALVYSTYLGGNGFDGGNGIAVDSSGDAYVTGLTDSSNFPTSNALQPTYAGGPAVGIFGRLPYDAFVAELNAAGSALIYSTYLGGTGDDVGDAVALDEMGDAYVTGSTDSTDFPTSNPLQPAVVGGTFVAQLNAAGSALVYSTYLGGSDSGNGIAVDGSGNVFVTGQSTVAGLPTVNPFQPANAGGNDAFVAKIASTIFTPHQLYVMAVYQDVLARAPDPQGLAYWANLLDQGAPISSVAHSIAHSAEYYGNFVIRPDYLKLLNRAPDDAGVQYWTTQMQNGLTDQQLEGQLAASDEFFNNAGGNTSAVNWIDAVYSLLLGRTADSGGEQYWSGKLTSLMSTESAENARLQVALGVAASQENNSNLINDDYFHYLGRDADAGGLAYWLQQFAAGATNEDVIAEFTGSAEYYQDNSG